MFINIYIYICMNWLMFQNNTCMVDDVISTTKMKYQKNTTFRTIPKSNTKL